MAESHVISALTAKRSELAGLVADYQRKLEQLRIDLGHLDATIKVFDPGYDLRTLAASAKAPRDRNLIFQTGECQRMTLDRRRQYGPHRTTAPRPGAPSAFHFVAFTPAQFLEQAESLLVRHAKDLAHGQRAGLGGEEEMLGHERRKRMMEWHDFNIQNERSFSNIVLCTSL